MASCVPSSALCFHAVCVFALFGCAGGQADHGSERAHASGEHEAPPEARAAEPAPPARPVGPPPVLALRVDATRDQTFAPVIQNRGTDLARVSAALMLERQSSGGEFQAVEGVSLSLRWNCATAAPECVELAPGAELRPPAWLGTIGDAQCECARCAAAPAGTYRFVVTTCNGDHRVAGEAFTR